MRSKVAFQQNILRYWRILELFEPQKIPQISSSPREHVRIEDVTGQHPLPWVNPAPVPQNPYKPWEVYEWAYYVYVGIFPQSLIFDELSQGLDEEEKEERRPSPQDETAIAALQVDHRGRLVLGSIQLTTALWALYRQKLLTTDHHLSISDTNKILNDYVLKREAQRVRNFKGLTRADEEITDKDLLEEQLPLDREFLKELHELCLLAQRSPKAIGGKLSDTAEKVLNRQNFRYKRTRIRVDPGAPAVEDDSDHLLGSFHLDELDAAIIDAGSGSLSLPLDRYLSDDSQVASIKRQDVRSDPSILEDGVSPSKMARGRWPSPPSHHLARSQQFTVNRVAQSSEPGNLLGVNGPPGTGKTTLLRDVYADAMVERASRLARLKRPEEGFRGFQRVALKNGEYQLALLAPELRGFEMVVVSANNTAVENISLELPSAGAIDSEFDQPQFFAEQASKVLTDSRSATGAWGMVAARLGNRANCRKFTGNYWYSAKPEGTQTMQDVLNNPNITRTWAQAVTAFHHKNETVKRLISAAHQAEQRYKNLSKLGQQLENITANLEISQTRYESYLPQEKRLGEQILEIEKQKKEIESRLNSYQQAKPGFWVNLFSFGSAYKEWFAGYKELQDEIVSIDAVFIEAAQSLAQLQDQKVSARADLEQLKQSLAVQRRELQELAQSVEADRQHYGAAHPDSSASGEVNPPWLTNELDRARSELFLEAMNLHRDFILHNSGKFRFLLSLACQLMVGIEIKKDHIPDIWAAFFMAVPLVSSTFASVSKLFTGMGRGSIGWVIVDEAGQAKPQQAVGALQLAQNALVVGDPLQLRPVVTLPESVSQRFARDMGISSDWTAPQASVQSLTDRVSAYGTMLGHDEEARWVSSPLRAHRRCDDPMFSISNAIAYDGAMIHCVSRAEDSRFLKDSVLEPNGPELNQNLISQWIHCQASDDTQKVQAGEIEQLKLLLAKLNAAGVPDSEIMVISPYRKVAAHLTKMGKDRKMGLRAGTIHITQGKEATAVILVLGTGKKSARSREWAAQSPHLLNVAVSRAKRRLYVIGDHDNWSGLPYFSDLSLMLSIHRRQVLSESQ